MEEIKLQNFDNLISSLNEIKNELIGDKEKEKKKEKTQKITQWITFSIAVISFLLSIYTILDNNKTDERNFGFQRETQAYNFWLSYLRLAAQNPNMANGLKEIDGVPINALACRDLNQKAYPDSTILKFVNYAWFVSNALGTAEVVSDLTKNDEGWTATIDTIISNHIVYVSAQCFEKEHYSVYINKEIEKVKSNLKK